MTRSAWDAAIEDYYAEHDTRRHRRRRPRARAAGDRAAPASRPGRRGHRARLWQVRQTLHDPEGHHDWVIDAVADLDASDEAGELVLATVAMHRL